MSTLLATSHRPYDSISVEQGTLYDKSSSKCPAALKSRQKGLDNWISDVASGFCSGEMIQ